MSGSERLLDVLLAVTTANGPQTARHVGATVNLPLSTAYRHLALLRDKGFVEDLGRETGFAPGPLVWRMALNFDSASPLRSIALPHMQRLSDTTRESVAIMKAVGTEVVCLEMLDSPQSLRCSFGKGRSHPLLKGASAKLLLACMPDASSAHTLHTLLPGAPRKQARLRAELAGIRGRGYAETSGELDDGVWGVSAPVMGAAGELECGLTLMAPISRSAARREKFIAMTIATAKRISKQLQTARSSSTKEYTYERPSHDRRDGGAAV